MVGQRLSFIGGVILVVSAPVAAAQQPTSPPAAPAEKLVCKSTSTIGSLVPKKVCHTRAEWTSINKANDRTMQQVRQENAPGTGAPPGP